MVKNCINKELSAIERKMLFIDAFKDKLTNLSSYNNYEIALMIYKILFFNKFENAIPISKGEVYKEIDLDDIIYEVKTVNNSAFYVRYKEMDIYFIFEDRNDKISIKCTNKLVNNTKEYEYVSFVDDIEIGIDDFIDSIQKQIERLLSVNELLNKNVKMLTDMID